jgi:threonine-phosphate decarboxylase
MDFAEAESSKKLVRNNPYLIILRSLTKFYALAGLRLGYLIAHNQTVARFAAYLEPWSVNGPAQKVALACLADRSFGLTTERWLCRERDFLTRRLEPLERFYAYPSHANFLLLRIAGRGDAVELRTFLLRKKIIVRVCDSFAGLGSNHCRIAVRRRKDNRLLLGSLAEWNEELYS